MEKQLLTKFLDKYCQGDIEELLTFDMLSLVADSEFGCNDRSFDCDDTNIVRIIFYLLYKDRIHGLTLDKIGTGKEYRGDTINSFNTVFGKRVSENHFLGVEKFSTDISLFSKVERFYRLYHTIGNFCLLPNNSYNNTTINLYRGTSAWKDYFDLFLIELQKCLVSDSSKDETLNNLIIINESYFKNLNYSIEEFKKFNYLDDYPINRMFEPYLYHWKFKIISRDLKEEYVIFINKYIDIATNLILKRGKRIIKNLKKVGGCYG